MAMLGKVRAMYFRDGKSISEISRQTSLSRNTIKRWLRAQAGEEPRYRRPAMPTKLEAYAEGLRQALRADAHRPKRERRTAKRLYEELKRQGYAGGYSRLTDFIRAWREGEGKAAHREAFVPLRFAPGEAFQFDWSEESLVVGGLYRKLCVAHMKLCASRAFWLTAYPSQGHEMLFDAHTRSFEELGGVPRRGIYDNMKTAVDKVCQGKARVVNARFAALCAHYLFEADFCNVASGWEKGVVEKNVQDSRRRIWQEASQRRFGDLKELNVWLGERCRLLWSEIRHAEYEPFSVAEMLEHERPHLMPMPAVFDGYVEHPARVSTTCLVTVSRNRYSVPCEWSGRLVSTRLYPERVVVVGDDTVIAEHVRFYDRKQTRYDWQHYIPLIQRKPGALRNGAPFAEMPTALRQLQQALLRHAGGDRVMAQVLSAVPAAGLEAVLVAVELVLESGAVSAEHVLNVVGRLTAAVTPAQIETALTLQEPPRADAGRYDALRAPTEADHA